MGNTCSAYLPALEILGKTFADYHGGWEARSSFDGTRNTYYAATKVAFEVDPNRPSQAEEIAAALNKVVWAILGKAKMFIPERAKGGVDEVVVTCASQATGSKIEVNYKADDIKKLTAVASKLSPLFSLLQRLGKTYAKYGGQWTLDREPSSEFRKVYKARTVEKLDDQRLQEIADNLNAALESILRRDPESKTTEEFTVVRSTVAFTCATTQSENEEDLALTWTPEDMKKLTAAVKAAEEMANKTKAAVFVI